MGMAILHRGSVELVIWARFECHRCVGSHVLCTCRLLYFEVALGRSARVFFLILGRRKVRIRFSALGSLSSFFSCLFISLPNFDFLFRSCISFAISNRSRNFREGVRLLAVTVGVLSSFI